MDTLTRQLTNPSVLTFYQMKSELSSLGSHSKGLEKCSICQEEFLETDSDLFRLSLCVGHYFHGECISQCRQGKNFVKCPNCSKVYGIQMGSMPSGKMHVERKAGKVAGFDCSHYFQIVYNIDDSWVNGINYPGTNRTAYLPDTPKGNYALSLLTIGFHRGLNFTVGISVTNGVPGAIWAIHHKTQLNEGPYGYPDPEYLDRLIEELNSRGVYLQ